MTNIEPAITDIERKALALVNEVQKVRGHTGSPWNSPTILNEALYRAIEQHEAFQQEVSDAVESLCNTVLMSHGYRQLREMLSRRFIIPKTDPLVEVINDADNMVRKPDAPSYAEAIRAALAARGLEIREKQQ